MLLVKQIVRLVLVIALATYAFDCSAGTTQEQAMQCCKSMHCSSHAHHGQDCCKSMPSMHGPFVQPSGSHDIAVSPAVFEAAQAAGDSACLDFSGQILAAQCHAPPIFHLSAPLPLRI